MLQSVPAAPESARPHHLLVRSRLTEKQPTFAGRTRSAEPVQVAAGAPAARVVAVAVVVAAARAAALTPAQAVRACICETHALPTSPE